MKVVRRALRRLSDVVRSLLCVREMTMKCGLCLVIGLVLGMAMTASAIAQDAGSATMKLQSVGKLQTQSQAASKPSITGATTGNSKPGAPGNKASGGSGSPVGVAPPSHTPTSARATAATTNGPSINGTAMVRPAARTATVGGSARVTAGVLSGSSITPKHP